MGDGKWKFDLLSKISTCLKSMPEQRFTAREIANWILKEYPEDCRGKQERSKAKKKPLESKGDLQQQISAEIGSAYSRLQKEYPEIIITGGRPRKHYYTKYTENEEIGLGKSGEVATASKANAFIEKEQDLYLLLSNFLWSELKIYSKRIDEKTSRNSKGPSGNKWLHPDLVGLENLSADWDDETKMLAKEFTTKKTKLWSFEVKVRINRSNLREAFFQAVSNSSWANFGYLVTSELREDAFKELRMLTSLHGIGFITLNVEDFSESQIIIPARERSEIDWNSVNRLIRENEDFKEYIKFIREFYQTGNIRESDWDMCVDED